MERHEIYILVKDVLKKSGCAISTYADQQIEDLAATIADDRKNSGRMHEVKVIAKPKLPRLDKQQMELVALLREHGGLDRCGHDEPTDGKCYYRSGVKVYKLSQAVVKSLIDKGIIWVHKFPRRVLPNGEVAHRLKLKKIAE